MFLLQRLINSEYTCQNRFRREDTYILEGGGHIDSRGGYNGQDVHRVQTLISP
jgi:hypothetical protein